IIRKYPFQRMIEELQPDFGQKTQSSHIDPEDGNASFPGKSRSVKHGSVAAQDQKYIRFARQLAILIAPLFTEKYRRCLVQNHVDASSTKPAHHIVQRTFNLRKLRLCQNPDALASHLMQPSHEALRRRMENLAILSRCFF